MMRHPRRWLGSFSATQPGNTPVLGAVDGNPATKGTHKTCCSAGPLREEGPESLTSVPKRRLLRRLGQDHEPVSVTGEFVRQGDCKPMAA